MRAAFEGRCYFVADRTASGVWLTADGGSGHRQHVSMVDRDLILDPSDEDLALAAAYERGEISAFEYADGHTYPPAVKSFGRGGPAR